MFKKSIIAFAAAVFAASASGGFAAEDPENKIGDRYPFLEQTAARAPAKFVTTRMKVRQTAAIHELGSYDPENLIGDRYPFLERNASAARAAAPRVRMSRQSAVRASAEIEDPENRIADRYPQLEPVQVQRAATGIATAGRKARATKRKV